MSYLFQENVYRKQNQRISSEEMLLIRDTIEKKDKELRDRGQLIGRYVFEYVGSQTAYYEITRISTMNVRVKAATSIIVPRWGKETILPLSYVKKNIDSRDNIYDTLQKKISV